MLHCSCPAILHCTVQSLTSIPTRFLSSKQEMEKLAGRPYVVLYFNASAPLPLLPDTVFLAELHAALPPRHKTLLQALYCVHPGAVARSWAFVLRLQDPGVYSKVTLLTPTQNH